MQLDIDSLIKAEGWQIVDTQFGPQIEAFGQLFPVTHPLLIRLKLYRLEQNPELKYQHMKAAHDYLWPNTLWHSWTERRFREHCSGWNFITYAGGAACSKSYDAAKIALLFWLANPKKRTVIVASTSLESLESRIWGYVTKLLGQIKQFDIPYRYLSGKPPKILYDYSIDPLPQGKKLKDSIHGMFAVAAKQGDDENVISSWIGRHPDEAILVVLDEATDMPPALTKSLPNLSQGVEFYQFMAIGNSNSMFDLHGALSTPKHGWKSIDPLVDCKWETTQDNGVCLFFSCYESPAIHEINPELRAKLGKFLITTDTIEAKKKLLGADSDSFWRFVLGFWRSSSTDETVISRQFIEEFDVFSAAEWGGVYPLHMVGGLDPAFSTGGDHCVLRLAILGVTYDGQVVLDYLKERLLFHIKITAASEDSADIQIANQVIKICSEFGCNLYDVAVDANGQGRALAEVIRLKAGAMRAPIKIYSTRTGNIQQKSFDVEVRTSHELWFNFRNFIQNRQIKGLDNTTIMQLTSRLVIIKDGKQKLESKHDFKNRMGAIMPSLAHSPDEADAASLVLQAAMINYGFAPGQVKIKEVSRDEIQDKFYVYKMLNKQRNQEVGKMSGYRRKADFSASVESMAGVFKRRF